MGVESAIFEIIHESIRHDESVLTVSALCEIAGVSRSGYYRWEAAAGQRAKQEEQDQEGEELTLIDLESFYDLLMEQQEQM